MFLNDNLIIDVKVFLFLKHFFFFFKLFQVKNKTPVPNKKLFGKNDDLQSLLMVRCDSDSNHDDSDQESDYYFSEEGDV